MDQRPVQVDQDSSYTSTYDIVTITPCILSSLYEPWLIGTTK